MAFLKISKMRKSVNLFGEVFSHQYTKSRSNSLLLSVNQKRYMCTSPKKNMAYNFQWADDNASPSSPITSKYILPQNLRPNLKDISKGSIPVIDMKENDENTLIESIAKACKEWGFFQVINHGVDEKLCHKVLDVITKFFLLSNEEKACLVSSQHMEDGKIFKYYVNNEEDGTKIPMWSESLFHTWHPTDDSFTRNLPNNPSCYRETIAAYAKEMGCLVSRLLGIMSQGLGLDKECIQNILGENPSCSAQAHYYPACSNPELTLGLRPHTDFKVLTVILQEQGVVGIHVLNKDEKWVAVEPIPGALVVNVADQLQVLSNDKYKSATHRAVINKEKRRVSYAMFYGPNNDTFIEPIKDLIDKNNPPLYRKYAFGEFIEEFRKQEGQRRRVKEVFKIQKN